MQGRIITTGTELITGRVGDFNGRYAARRLHEAGLEVQSISMLGDRAPLLQTLLAQALVRSQFIIITGGLGPTDDDITGGAAAAQALNLRLFEDEALLARIRRCLEERGLPWEERYARLAVIPEGATVLDPGGAPCGFSLRHRDAWIFFLPGVPREMRVLFDSFVLPFLVGFAGGGKYMRQRTLRLFGITETQLQETVNKMADWHQEVCVGFYPNFPENHLTLTLRGPEPQTLERQPGPPHRGPGPGSGGGAPGPEAVSLEEMVGQKAPAAGPDPGGGGVLYRRPHLPSPHRRARRLGLFPGGRGE